MSAITVNGVLQGGVPRTDVAALRRAVVRRQWVDGVALVIRVELAEESWQHADLKHYWGHIIKPFCDYTGYSRHEAHAELFKPMFMPEGKTSLTQLSRPELKTYIEDVLSYIRDNCPEALVEEAS